MGPPNYSGANGAKAWNVLQEESISLVISDWMMPEMNGLELCCKIRCTKFDRYVYVILLTAKNEKSELVAGMKAGADWNLILARAIGFSFIPTA